MSAAQATSSGGKDSAVQAARESWRSIISAFHPLRGVRPEEVEHCFVDRQEDNPTHSLVHLLKRRLHMASATPYRALLMGQVGSGKSWELMRLAQEVADDFFVVWFDAESTFTLETVNHFDVLLGIGLAIHAVAESSGLNPNDQLATDLLKSFAKFVRQYEARQGFALRLAPLLKQVVACTPWQGARPATESRRAVPRLGLNVRDDLIQTLELPTNCHEILAAFHKLIADTQRKAHKPLLVITDGLDKVPANRAWQLFATSALLTAPACALVYAAPMELYQRLTSGPSLFDDYHLLPNVTVHQRPQGGDAWHKERVPNAEGLRVMRKVVTKRLAAHGQEVDKIIAPAAMDLLALMSGGVMRELVRSMREAATFAQLLGKVQIDAALAQQVMNQQRQELAPRLNLSYREALRRALSQERLCSNAAATVESELLRNLFLLAYQDKQGHCWLDGHPNILPLL